MIRRKAMKMLSLLTFGLFLPKQAPATAKTTHSIELEPDCAGYGFSIDGKVYSLGMRFSGDEEKDRRAFNFLVRSFGDALWAIGRLPPPERYAKFDADALALIKEDNLRRMGRSPMTVDEFRERWAALPMEKKYPGEGFL